MNTSKDSIRQLVAQAAAEVGIKAQNLNLAQKVKTVRQRVLDDWNALLPPEGLGAFALESLSSGTPRRNQAFQAAGTSPTKLVRELHNLGMAPRHITQVAESVMGVFDNNYRPETILRDGYDQNGNYMPLQNVVGRTAAAQLALESQDMALEAFGDDINRLNTDDRLTVDLMIMRPFENIMDKALARVNDSSPVVTIRIPSPEAYDWAVTQKPNSTVYERSGSTNTYRLRDLYRNPTPVNSSPKRIQPLTANDSAGVLWNSTQQYYKTGLQVSLLDLSRSTNTYNGDKIDRTDLVADGGYVDAAIVAITNPNGGNPVTENFLIPTRALALSNFVISPNNRSSGQRQAMFTVVYPISATTKQWNNENSTIAAALTDAKIQVVVDVNARLNLQTGLLNVSGSVRLELKQLANGTPISNGTNTLFGTLTAALAAASVELYFDEENQRKANLAVWVQYMEQQFVVPRSRIYFTEYSLAQDMDENAVSATSSMMALGNGRRGLDIVVNALNDVANTNNFIATNPEIAQANALDDRSFASSLVKPTVMTTELNFGTEELNTLNESTRLTEMHGRFRARFLQIVTTLFAQSLMINQYPAGERPVIKAWVHQTIADVVIGILDYHPDLKDDTTIASGADYSMLLPNGYRLDVIKSNFDCLKGRIYAVPVIESDMASILSAASIRDCGMVTTNYTPTTNGAVVRRVATTTREIVMMSNTVGVCMIVTGLQAQLGSFGYTPVTLAADTSDTIAL